MATTSPITTASTQIMARLTISQPAGCRPRRGIRVITDLVLNHTSDQHAWFQAARADRSSPYREYYVWSDTDQKYQDARIIFLDTEKSNWTWDETAGQYFWHRFYASQPDLNYDNPAVRRRDARRDEVLAGHGHGRLPRRRCALPGRARGHQLRKPARDARVPKEMRRLLDEHYPDRILLCEANQWPDDVRPYFGDSDEFHMAFHFPVMPRIYMALRRERLSRCVIILDQTPAIPDRLPVVHILAQPRRADPGDGHRRRAPVDVAAIRPRSPHAPQPGHPPPPGAPAG